MLDRPALLSPVRAALVRSPAVALVGPRQVGKTTLARSLASGAGTHRFDLEDPQVTAQLAAPMLALRGLSGLVVIDEVQLAPDLFNVLRVLVDRPGNPARFLLLGSASPALLRQSSEPLAGRIEIIEAGGFTLEKTGARQADTLWWRGGFPGSHRAEVVGQRKPRDLPQFKWVNTVLGNLKTMVSGAYKAFGYRKYADRYLGAFAYRFNRRFDLADLVVRLVVDVSRGKAAPERVIRHA